MQDCLVSLDVNYANGLRDASGVREERANVEWADRAETRRHGYGFRQRNIAVLANR